MTILVAMWKDSTGRTHAMINPQAIYSGNGWTVDGAEVQLFEYDHIHNIESRVIYHNDRPDRKEYEHG